MTSLTSSWVPFPATYPSYSTTQVTERRIFHCEQTSTSSSRKNTNSDTIFHIHKCGCTAIWEQPRAVKTHLTAFRFNRRCSFFSYVPCFAPSIGLWSSSSTRFSREAELPRFTRRAVFLREIRRERDRSISFSPHWRGGGVGF